MRYATEHVAGTLKAARKAKGLTQRALGKLAGVPQSHISKIENGVVDLRLSSLVEIARVLDQEVTLVPRKAISAVQSIVRGSQPVGTVAGAHSASRELKRLQDSLNQVTHKYPAIREIAQLQRQVRELQHFKVAIPELNALREANKTIRAFEDSTKGLSAIRNTLSDLRRLRNSIAQALPTADTVTPAYSLDETDHG